jgi:Rieske Fe-S protein
MTITRRQLIKASVAGGLALAVVPAASCIDPPPVYDAAVGDDPTRPSVYGSVRVRVADMPELAVAGGSVALRLAPLADPDRPRPFALPSPPEILVAHRPLAGDEAWAAFDSACPHLGCPLAYSPSADQIECPCHRSRFRPAPDPADSKSCAGDVLKGPAQQGPTAYPATYDAATGVLRIDLTAPLSCATTRLPPVEGGKVTLAVAGFPALARADGVVAGRPRGLAHDLAVVRVSNARDASAILAVDPTCTHLGCTVTWSPGDGPEAACGEGVRGFVCPCHCSRFDAAAQVTLGPAMKALRRFAVSFDGDTIVVSV